jgi:Chlorophyll A-B binding protein
MCKIVRWRHVLVLLRCIRKEDPKPSCVKIAVLLRTLVTHHILIETLIDNQQQQQQLKMKSVIFASLIASAAAFAPAQQSASTSVATNMAKAKAVNFANELGVQQPLGFWDPLGLLASGDQAKFDRLRYVELKHGRIAMLAVAGYLTAESGARLPGLISYDGTTFADVPNGFSALSSMPGAGLAQILAFIGFLEIAFMKDVPGKGNEFIGDFRNGFIDYGWKTFNAETKMKKRAIELNNGRAAQMGILALMVHEQLGVSVLP